MASPLDQPVVCPVLVGRAPLLATIERAIEQASAGRGQTLALAGEAGIGKSRLAREARQRAQQRGMAVLEGRCFESDRLLPFGPFLDLLRTSPPIPPAGERLGPLAAAFAPLLPEFTAPAPAGGATSDAIGDPDQERRRRFAALTGHLLQIAERRPLLLIVEDLHWGDDATFAFLLSFARQVARRPIALLLTYRAEGDHDGLTQLLAGLDRERLATELPLEPLPLAGTEAMLRAIFAGRRAVPADLLHRLHRLTEGNPFQLEETLKTLLMAGDLDFAAGRWRYTPSEGWPIPRGAQDAVRRRARRLGPAAARVLALAAVIGQRFDVELLGTLARLDEAALLGPLKELLAAQLVVELSADQFAFRHALTRQAVYAGLLARERRALHRQVAAALAQLPSPRHGQHLADLAYHHFAGEDWAPALAYARQAGERAQALHAPRAAIEHYTQALTAVGALGLAPPPDLHRARGRAYEVIGDFARAREDLEAALAAARAGGDRPGEWQALLDLGFLWASRDFPQAGDHFRAALALARGLGDDARLGRSLNRVGNWHLNSGRPAEAIRHYEEALAIFEDAHDRPGVAETLDLLGMATMHAGDVLGGNAYYERAIPLLRELDDRRGLVSSLTMLAEIHAGFGGLADVTPGGSVADGARRAEEAIAIARALSWSAGEAYATMGLAVCRLALGDFGQALALIRRTRGIAEKIEHRGWLVGARLSLGGLCLELRALPAAREHLEQALAEARAIGSGWFVRLATIYLAFAYLRGGDPELAETALDDAFGEQRPTVSAQDRACWLVRAELALVRGNPGRALAIADQLTTSAANHAAATAIPALWLVRGRALTALGRAEDAWGVLRPALETAQEREMRPLLWPIRIALGEAALARSRRGEAQDEFAAARTIIEALAATVPDEPLPEVSGAPLREQFLRGVTALLPPERPPTPLQAAKRAFGGLTAREREVAALIARGHSNREIAATLVIGERTVQTHIANIFAKLGCDSRAQVAAWAAEHGLTQRGAS